MTDKTLFIAITPELEKLLQAVKRANRASKEAYRQAEASPEDGLSRKIVDYLMHFERAEKEAKAALGQYVYRAYDDMLPDDL